MKSIVKNISRNSFFTREEATSESIKRNLNGEPSCIIKDNVNGEVVFRVAPREFRFW